MLNSTITYLRESSEDLIFFALVLLAAGLLMFQLTSLFVAPVADSYLWWGDESWLMLEFRTQILTGVFRHPFALASSLEHGSGLIFNNMWITAILYGIPTAVAMAGDIVMTGRIVTAMLSVTLVFALYEIIRKLTQERLLALFGVLLLLTSRSFFLTSHSARYDILSALSILVGVYILLRLCRPLSRKQSFLIGLCAASSILISIHVFLALILTALVTVVLRSNRKLLNFGFFALGLVSLALLLLVASNIEHISLAPAAGSAFALNMHDIPVLRISSRSVQFANIAQRWHTIATLALGYLGIGVLLIIFAIARLLKRRINWPHWLWIIAIALVSWLEFESAAPTSYLIYVLPVLSMAIALVLPRLIPGAMLPTLITIAAIVLVFFSFRDSWRARNTGLHLSRANDDAITAALAAIEQDTTRPLVLVFNPAVHRVLADTTVRLMTTQFVEFPITNELVDSAIRREHVRYVLLYRSAWKQDYMREVEPIATAARRMGTLVWERASPMTDIGRSYFNSVSVSDTPQNDTLQVYRLRD